MQRSGTTTPLMRWKMSGKSQHKTGYGAINTTSGQNVQKWKRSFECTLGKRKHPIPQWANLMVSDARQGNPKGMPCLYFITGRGIRHKKLFPKQIKFKERKR